MSFQFKKFFFHKIISIELKHLNTFGYDVDPTIVQIALNYNSTEKISGPSERKRDTEGKKDLFSEKNSFMSPLV